MAGASDLHNEDCAHALLAWYDRERRVLPWRAAPGVVPDPYRVWLSEIMLQQTTVKAVLQRHVDFLRRWPDVRALANAELGEVLAAWAGLGYYARARNLHACAREVVARFGGSFPKTEAELHTWWGAGLVRVPRAALKAVMTMAVQPFELAPVGIVRSRRLHTDDLRTRVRETVER